MLRILKTLDQIAREKQRSVLFVTFHKENMRIFSFDDEDNAIPPCSMTTNLIMNNLTNEKYLSNGLMKTISAFKNTLALHQK